MGSTANGRRWRKMRDLTKTQKWLYAAAALCLGLSIFYEFVPIGYRMTAVVFLFGAVWLALYAMFSRQNTKLSRRMRLAMVLFVTLGFPCFLAAEIPVLRDARSDEDTSAPYLIVCGAGVNGTVPSRSMTDRLSRAMDWLAENPEGVAILSGAQGPHEDVTEARAMFGWLTDQGIDPARLRMEDRAENSLGNIRCSLELIEKDGGDPSGRVAILSSEYHLHRLGWMARKLGCQPVLVAAKTTKVSLFINYAVREAFAMWKLWVFGM